MKTVKSCRNCKPSWSSWSVIRLYQRITSNGKQKFLGSGWICGNCGFIELQFHRSQYASKNYQGILKESKRGSKK